MDLILELLFGFAYAFFGALVGVLWTPHTASWARWQFAGIASALGAVAGFSVTFFLARDGWTPLVSSLFWIASALAISYLIIGNMCRRFHEKNLQQ